MVKKIFVIMLVVFFALFVAKDFLIKSRITSIGSNIVGVPMKIRKFSLGILSQRVRYLRSGYGFRDGFLPGGSGEYLCRKG